MKDLCLDTDFFPPRLVRVKVTKEQGLIDIICGKPDSSQRSDLEICIIWPVSIAKQNHKLSVTFL